MPSPPPPIDFTESEREVCVPVAVVLQRGVVRARRWSLPQWSLFAVIAGGAVVPGAASTSISASASTSPSPPSPPPSDSLLIHDDGTQQRYLRRGLVLHLYKDGSEGYWYNLLSEPPYLFVVCDGEQGDDAVSPAFVTANQDEANGYMESDRLVLSAPMPRGICDILERYVISHYAPAVRRKRSRREWAGESVYAKRAAKPPRC